MSSRRGFALSLLAACGIHAGFLLLPRGATVEAVPVPIVVVDLTEVAIPELPAEAAPPAARTIAARAPTRTASPDPAQSPPSPPARFPATVPGKVEPASAPPVQDEGTPVIEQPVSASSGKMETAGIPHGDTAVRGSAASGAADTAEGTVAAAGTVAVAAAPAFTPPRPLSRIDRTYPLSARRAGFEGVVKVDVRLDETGAVIGVEVVSSSGHASLDQAALEALRRAQFTPALRDGKPVASRIVVPMRYVLKAPDSN